MRSTLLIIPLSAVLLTLAACGTTHRTVIVNPQPGSAVVVQPNGDTKVVTPN